MDERKPTGDVMTAYKAAERQYAHAHPDALVFGDSRAFMWPDDQVRDALHATSVANLGDIGSVVEDALWRAGHTRVDLSHVTQCVVEIGINNLNRWGDTESANFIAKGFDKLVSVLAAKCAPGCEFYVMEPFEETPRGVETEKMRARLTHVLAAHAEAHGYAYVSTRPMDPSDTSYFRPGGLHLTDLGYATYMTPVLQAVAAPAAMAASQGGAPFSFAAQGPVAITGHDTPFVASLLDEPLSHHFILEDVDLGHPDPFLV